MNLKIRKLNDVLFYVTFFLLLYIPKVNVISFSFSYVGVKPEDFWFVILCLCMFIQIFIFRRYEYLKMYDGKYIIFFLLITVIFVMFNYTGIKNIAFCGRYLEYFLYLWFGILISVYRDDIQEDKWIARMIFFAFIFWVGASLLEDMSLEGRKKAIFTHPTELAGVVLFLSWLYSGLQQNVKSKVIVFVLGSILILLSESRATLFVMLICVFFAVKNYMNKKIKLIFTSIAFVLVFCVPFFIDADIDANNKLYRIEAMLTSDAIDSAFNNFALAEPKELEDVAAPEVVGTDGDMSLNIRITKWGIIIANVAQNFFLIGLGAGNIGEATDGFYIRVLGENGIIGVVLFLLIIKLLFNSVKNVPLVNMVKIGTIGLLLNAIFIDTFYFSRIACIFWFSWGAIIANYSKMLSD